MSKYLKLMILLSIPAIVFASGGDNAIAENYFKMTGRHTDFGPRVFNFLLLVGLLYYLLAEPIKNFLKNRSESIAEKLAEIEKKRQESKSAKVKAEQELEYAKKRAIEIIEDAKAEISLIKEKIEQHTQEELIALEKMFSEKMDIEKRKVVREVTKSTLSENITPDDIPLDASKIVNIVTKDVA